MVQGGGDYVNWKWSMWVGVDTMSPDSVPRSIGQESVAYRVVVQCGFNVGIMSCRSGPRWMGWGLCHLEMIQGGFRVRIYSRGSRPM